LNVMPVKGCAAMSLSKFVISESLNMTASCGAGAVPPQFAPFDQVASVGAPDQVRVAAEARGAKVKRQARAAHGTRARLARRRMNLTTASAVNAGNECLREVGVMGGWIFMVCFWLEFKFRPVESAMNACAQALRKRTNALRFDDSRAACWDYPTRLWGVEAVWQFIYKTRILNCPRPLLVRLGLISKAERAAGLTRRLGHFPVPGSGPPLKNNRPNWYKRSGPCLCRCPPGRSSERRDRRR